MPDHGTRDRDPVLRSVLALRASNLYLVNAPRPARSADPSLEPFLDPAMPTVGRMDISPRAMHAPIALALALTAALAAGGCQPSTSDSDDFFRVADAPGAAGSAGGSTPAVAERVVVEAPSQDAVERDGDVAREDDVPRDDGPGRSAAESYMRRDATGPTAPDAPARKARTAPPVADARAPRVAAARDAAKVPPRDATPERARETAAQARTHAATATAIDGDARSLNARAIALINGGRPEAAIPLLEHALVLQPRDAEMLGNLGYAYMLVGEHARARSRFVAALDLSPTRSATWLNLGQTYAELGRQDAALDAVLKGYRYSTRKASVRSALQRAATQPQFSPAWRDTAGAALSRIEAGA